MYEKEILAAKALRRELHMIPELSGKEIRTKARLMDFMREHTDLEIIDMGKWFYCAHREEGAAESIGFRADFDAVPGPDGSACHLCGHDGHSASLAAFGMALKGKTIGKNLFLLFQFGEETGEGGYPCSEGLFGREKVDRMFAYHNAPGKPLGAVGIQRGTYACASEGLILTFTGTPAHASQPENGRNPAFAISSLVSELERLAAPEDYEGMVLCTVIHIHVGEPAFGMSASRGKLLLTIRGAAERDMETLKKRILGRAKVLADQDGLEFSWDESDVFPDTTNHDACADFLREVCAKAGIPTYEKEMERGSEDFGWFLKRVPGAMVGIGSGCDHAPLHTAGYEYPDEIIGRVVELWMAVAEA